MTKRLMRFVKAHAKPMEAPRATGVARYNARDGRGMQRAFDVIAPSNSIVDGGGQLSLAITFVFHGAGGNPHDAQALGLQRVAGAAQKSIFVFPEGVTFRDQGVGWDDRCDGYDVVFFDNMLTELRQRFRVDPTQIYVAGFSWGADFVTALLCCRGELIRAAAVASCTDEYADPRDFRTYSNFPCRTGGKTAIRFTFDSNGDHAYSATQFRATLSLYRHLNSCSETWTKNDSVCDRYDGCSAPFIACGYSALGHSTPPHWAEESWRFFELAASRN
ncbi:MAG TPA: hypothetical protein VIV60_33310 [Polyangiaceae bacterium]